jgi:hypothetical protein
MSLVFELRAGLVDRPKQLHIDSEPFSKLAAGSVI